MIGILKKLIAFIVVFCLASLLFAFGYQKHNEQLLEYVYGIDGGWNTMKGMSELTKKKYYIVSDAAYLAIDFNGDVSQGRKLENLKQNLLDIGENVDDIPSLDEFIKLGGGNHRAYNHQGFDHEYNDVIKDQRWNTGKRLLSTSIEKAYGLGDEVSDVIVREIYYNHMIGDLLEGQVSSVLQMGKLSSFGDLVDSFADEISDLSVIDKKYVKKLRKLADKYSDVKITKDMDADTIASVRKQIEKGQDEFSDIIQDINKNNLDWDVDIRDLAGKTKKLNSLAKITGQTALSGLFSAGVVAGMELLLYGKITDYKEIIKGGGIGVVSSLLDTGAAYLSKKVVSKIPSKLLKGVTATGVAVAADSIIDMALLFMDYRNGDITKTQLYRNSAVKLTSNTVAFLSVQGVTYLFAGMSSVSPIIGAVGVGVYLGASYLADKIIEYIDLDEIRKSANDTEQLKSWVDAYWVEMQSQK